MYQAIHEAGTKGYLPVAQLTKVIEGRSAIYKAPLKKTVLGSLATSSGPRAEKAWAQLDHQAVALQEGAIPEERRSASRLLAARAAMELGIVMVESYDEEYSEFRSKAGNGQPEQTRTVETGVAGITLREKLARILHNGLGTPTAEM